MRTRRSRAGRRGAQARELLQGGALQGAGPRAAAAGERGLGELGEERGRVLSGGAQGVVEEVEVAGQEGDVDLEVGGGLEKVPQRGSAWTICCQVHF